MNYHDFHLVMKLRRSPRRGGSLELLGALKSRNGSGAAREEKGEDEEEEEDGKREVSSRVAGRRDDP